jgi:uncharacterized protein YukE
MELSFDTEQGRSMATKMLTTMDTVDKMIKAVETVTNALVGVGWIAPAAQAFKRAVDAWLSQIKPIVTKMRELKLRLDHEIAQWEETAGTLAS